jgi:hypothetical protein
MKAETLSEQEVFDIGLSALRERLGVVGTVRFLRKLGGGFDDYTGERGNWLDTLSQEDIVAGIRQIRDAGESHHV